MDAAVRGPAEVLGDERRWKLGDEPRRGAAGACSQSGSVEPIERPDAVQAERMVAARRAQQVERAAAAAEVVLGVHLDEADIRLACEELDAVLGAQADAGGQGQARVGRGVDGAKEAWDGACRVEKF
jgi:hypothetical protein